MSIREGENGEKPSLFSSLVPASAKVRGGETGKVILVLDEIGLKCMDNWIAHWDILNRTF